MRITDAGRALIVRALGESGGNRIIASQSLGISRRTLSDNLASIGLPAAGAAHKVNNQLEIIGNHVLGSLTDTTSCPSS